MNSSKKRGFPQDASGGAGASQQKRLCSYGAACYRRNPAHFEEFSHPHLEKLLNDQTSSDVVIPPDLTPSIVLPQLDILRQQQVPLSAGASSPTSVVRRSPIRDTKSHEENDSPASLGVIMNIADKLKASSPYNCFMCTVDSARKTFYDHNSVQFSELLDKSLGEFHSSLQINFMVEMEWLMSNYKIHDLHRKPLTLLYSDGDEILRDKMPPWITAVKVRAPTAFGHHHTKMMIILYTDGGIRIIVSTANLIESDWDNRNQGVWVSPLCPKLPSGSNANSGESATEFKADLIRYLSNYGLPQLKNWISSVREADCSKINVFFVASVPGTHEGLNFYRWGHLRVSKLLQQHAVVPDGGWPIIAQCSSIGSLGPTLQSWVGGEWLSSFRKGARDTTTTDVKLVYPSFKNVASCYDGIAGGCCLPYSIETHKKQTWLTSIMHQWKSDHLFRSAAMPHIKTYTRLSPACDKVAWFLLSSSNLSKAAWGMVNKQKTALRIMSYEVGVLFLPKFVNQSSDFSLHGEGAFPLPYDVPLTPYEPNDKPWVAEYMQKPTVRERQK